VAEANREMIATYQKAVQDAFREVSDALTDYNRNLERRKQQELFVQALQDADGLSQMRYRGSFRSCSCIAPWEEAGSDNRARANRSRRFRGDDADWDAVKSNRVMQARRKMDKIDIKGPRQAYGNE
jgi:hypothetical protein